MGTIMKKTGILLPVGALPAKYGIGDFGLCARTFIDVLKDNGIQVWQILPLGPVGYGNSPYQCASSHALEEMYVSPELLYEAGLIARLPEEVPLGTIHYEEVQALKRSLLREAYSNFQETEEFKEFCEQTWVKEYTLFKTWKEANGNRAFIEWPYKFRRKPSRNILHQYRKEIRFQMFIQYILHVQFTALKEKLQEAGISLMGDMPFYTGGDSDDVYFHPDMFLVTDGRPDWIAGVPPDYFSADGQRWGNPIYNWEAMKKDGYAWWLERIRANAELYDLIRIDHFRAFDTYWKIPASEPTAINGKWIVNDGDAFFKALYDKYPDIHIIAEDLGDLRPEVYELRDKWKLPGMRVLQFDFPSESRKEDVIYIGTHDNPSMRTWFTELPLEEQRKIYSRLSGEYSGRDVYDAILKYALDLPGIMVIFAVQDLLGGKERINTPGTIGSPNWEYRITDPDYADTLKETLERIRAR
ncbi:MAG: 4-alpha-glucanotransferase [Solobacterium sp.]|nr:4-alpha-glucanotransferase [Solobacterium sp.]